MEESKGCRRWCFVAGAFLAGVVVLFLFYTSETSINTWTSSAHSPASDQDHSAYLVPYPGHYGMIIDEPLRCERESPFLVLVVPVAPSDRTARSIIRQTWAQQPSIQAGRVQYYFLLGVSSEDNGTGLDGPAQRQLFEESRVHHDILQSDFVDSYRNLTIKTMVMFQWLRSHCPNSSYTMKLDSDVFVNLQKLVDALLHAPRLSFFTGTVLPNSVIIRDQSSKWYVPFSVFPGWFYPPYAIGMGYVFSMDLPDRILDASRRVKALYIEDVYVGLCLQELGVAVSDPPHGALFRTNLPLLMPRCYWTTVTVNLVKDSEHLLETWETFQRQLQEC